MQSEAKGNGKLSDEALVAALRRHPKIRERLERLLGVAQGGSGDLRLADDAEDRIADEIRLLGQEMLESWAQSQVEETEQELRRSGQAHREGKKNSAGTARLGT